MCPATIGMATMLCRRVAGDSPTLHVLNKNPILRGDAIKAESGRAPNPLPKKKFTNIRGALFKTSARSSRIQADEAR